MFTITVSEIVEIVIISVSGIILLRLSSIMFKYVRMHVPKMTLWGHVQVEIYKRVTQFIIVAAVFYYIITLKQHKTITMILEVLLVFVGAYLCAKVATLILELLSGMSVKEPQVTPSDLRFPMLSKLASIFIYSVAVLISLHYLGYNVTALLAGMGIAGIGLSLAAKDSLSNVIAGILLVLDKPFVPGDRIEIWNPPPNQSTWGDVMEVGLRSTKVRTTDNITIIIPNSQLMNRDIINYTQDSPSMRLRIPVSVSYESNLETVEKVLISAVKGIEGILDSPPPQVIVNEFGESSINVEVRVWIDHAKRRRTVQDQINRSIKLEFEKSSIEIPYPKRDVYIKEYCTRKKNRNE